MAKEKFEKRNLTGQINVACKFDDGSVRVWSDDKETVVERIQSLVNAYTKKGYLLTLRQLHYQFVSRNWIINHDTAYKKLGSILDDCKYAGLVNWDAIEDRGRVPHLLYSVDSVEEAIKDTVDYYRRNRQEGQNTVVELWTEKDALSGILKRSTQKYHIRLCVNKGYTSSTALYNTYKRIIEAFKNDQKFIVLYFGDHDPSGLDMVRDITDRLLLFLSQGSRLGEIVGFDDKLQDWWNKKHFTLHDLIDDGYLTYREAKRILSEYPKDSDYQKYIEARYKKYLIEEMFIVKPIGLTMNQIKEYELPPNPTKLTDTRADKYIKKFGKTCWEVDALEPEVLTSIVELSIETVIDVSQYKKMLATEKKDKTLISKYIK